jgi:hypothetical protein
MGSYSLSCFDISAINHSWDTFEDSYEEDPEQYDEYAMNGCYSVDLLIQVWASNAEEALEKAARIMGHQNSDYWLDFLNLGDERISLHVDFTPEPDMELHFYYNNPV